jgi:hypothetical protein
MTRPGSSWTGLFSIDFIISESIEQNGMSSEFTTVMCTIRGGEKYLFAEDDNTPKCSEDIQDYYVWRIIMKNFSVHLSPLFITFLSLAMTSCTSRDDAGKDRELSLNIDGKSCTYEGPTLLKPGPITLRFYNESEGWAATNLLKHSGDETIQDAIDYIGEEPTTKYRPAWAQDLGTWEEIAAGKSYRWKGDLELGIYHMVCASTSPGYGAWFGAGLTVED